MLAWAVVQMAERRSSRFRPPWPGDDLGDLAEQVRELRVALAKLTAAVMWRTGVPLPVLEADAGGISKRGLHKVKHDKPKQEAEQSRPASSLILQATDNTHEVALEDQEFLECITEEIHDVIAPQATEDTTDVVTFIPQVQAQDRMAGRSQERILEETADVHAPQVAEKSEVARLITQEPAQNRAMDKSLTGLFRGFGRNLRDDTADPARKNFRLHR